MTAPAATVPPSRLRIDFPDVRVVEQVEVVHSAQCLRVCSTENGDVLARAAPPVRAGRLDEQVAHHGPRAGFPGPR